MVVTTGTVLGTIYKKKVERTAEKLLEQGEREELEKWVDDLVDRHNRAYDFLEGIGLEDHNQEAFSSTLLRPGKTSRALIYHQVLVENEEDYGDTH